jgi:hypothetical protein
MSINNSELKSLLADCVTPERALLLGEIADYLTTLGLAGHELAVSSVFARFDNSDISQSIMEIERALYTELDALLRNHGVLMTGDSLQDTFTVVKALYGIENYGDPMSLWDVVNDDSQTTETMVAELAEFFEDIVPDILMDNIAEVKYSLIDRIKEVLSTKLATLSVDGPETLTDEYPLYEIARRRLRSFMDKDREDFFVYQQIKNGVPLALPFEHYVERAHTVLGELEGASLLRQLLAMANASDLSSEQFEPAIKEQLLVYGTSPDVVTKMTIDLERLL